MVFENGIERITLPAGDDPDLIAVETKAGWISAARVLTKGRARELLSERWKNLDKRLTGLRDRLLESEPLALVKGHGATTLELVRKPPPGLERAFDITYRVIGPTTEASVRASLRRQKRRDDKLLRDFLVAFDGLGDRPPTSTGGFVPHRGWKTIARFVGTYWGVAIVRGFCAVLHRLSGSVSAI
ncbi:MAG TPA: hypothetical protein VG269_18075 [Tepidisphaeraceae bacterium]|jgi:hypothetical protein|nr:hypothetical protein [Tepidisphaeraceae bacterium]